MNSNGLDEMIVGQCLNKAAQARKLKIPITTFMIATDPYLQQFIENFTEANGGKALFTGLNGLGDSIFMIAQDPYLRKFVEAFTAQNKGKAFLTGLSGLGEMIFEDYEKNRIKRI